MLNHVSELLGFGSVTDRVLIGTHHKCGTLWLKKIFSAVCTHLSLVMHHGERGFLSRGFDVLFDDHSTFKFPAFLGRYRGLHLIRDPRDVIISGAFYHERCTSEPWLLERTTRLRGRSYQQALTDLPSLEEKLRFEMRHCSGQTIRDMLAWNYANQRFYEAKYEDLIEDVELRRFREIFAFLRFPESEMEELLRIAYDNSLFSGKLSASTEHIRSGRPRQWHSYFTKSLHHEFLDLFGDALVRLGYEQDDQWCP